MILQGPVVYPMVPAIAIPILGENLVADQHGVGPHDRADVDAVLGQQP